MQKKNQVERKKNEKREKKQVQKTTRTALLIGGHSDRLCLKQHGYSSSLPVSEMTYTVSSGTLNPSIPYHQAACTVHRTYHLSSV